MPPCVARGFHKRSSMAERVWRVRRRCLVCEAEAELTEPAGTDEIGPPCGVCHAPTERLNVLEEIGGDEFPHLVGRRFDEVVPDEIRRGPGDKAVAPRRSAWLHGPTVDKCF